MRTWILDIYLVFLQFVTCLFILVFYRQEALSSAVSEKDAHLQWLEVTFEHRQIFCDSMFLYNLLLYLQFYSYLRATRLLVRGAATRTRVEPWRGCAGRGGTCSTGWRRRLQYFSLIFCSTKWRKRSQRLLFVHFWFNLMKREVAEPILFLSLWRNLKLVTKLIAFLFRMRTAWRWSLRWTRRLPSSREPARSQRLATSTAESHL